MFLIGVCLCGTLYKDTNVYLDIDTYAYINDENTVGEDRVYLTIPKTEIVSKHDKSIWKLDYDSEIYTNKKIEVKNGKNLMFQVQKEIEIKIDGFTFMLDRDVVVISKPNMLTGELLPNNILKVDKFDCYLVEPLVMYDSNMNKNINISSNQLVSINIPDVELLENTLLILTKSIKCKVTKDQIISKLTVTQHDSETEEEITKYSIDKILVIMFLIPGCGLLIYVISLGCYMKYKEPKINEELLYY